MPRLVRLPRDLGYIKGPRLASALRKAWVKARNPHATIEFGERCYLGPGFSLHIPFSASFIAGRGVEFRRGFRAELARGAEVLIGDETQFTYGVVVQCGRSIEVGDRCMFAQASAIFDGNHRFRELERPVAEQGYDLRPVRIDDDVVVGSKCTIIASIGARTFVGANSVVTRDLPPYVVAVGAPARSIDYFGPGGTEPPELSSTRSPDSESG